LIAGDPSEVRAYVARVASTLHQSLAGILSMPFRTMLGWYIEAIEIDRETNAYLRMAMMRFPGDE
jgi:hypothetical protein